MSNPALNRAGGMGGGWRFNGAAGRPLSEMDVTVSGSTDLSGVRKARIEHHRSEDTDEMDGKYTVTLKLGQGAFGTVRLATDTAHPERQVAIKTIKKRHGAVAHADQLVREVVVMKKVNHPHIVQLYEVFETPQRFALVMEYCPNGDLVSHVRKLGAVSHEQVRTIMTRLLDAVAYLHEYGVVHRDIKPENILLAADRDDDQFDLKLSDFGLATYTNACAMMDNVCGTPFYMAPEVCNNLPYSAQCDIWSCGVIMYLLFCHFARDMEPVLQQMILSGKIEFPDRYWSGVPQAPRHLIENMLKFDPAYRITAAEAGRHSWVTGIQGPSGGVSSPQTVFDLMRSYNAERRLRKALLVVAAVVRLSWATGARLGSGTTAQEAASTAAISTESGQSEDAPTASIATADVLGSTARLAATRREAGKAASRDDIASTRLSQLKLNTVNGSNSGSTASLSKRTSAYATTPKSRGAASPSAVSASTLPRKTSTVAASSPKSPASPAKAAAASLPRPRQAATPTGAPPKSRT